MSGIVSPTANSREQQTARAFSLGHGGAQGAASSCGGAQRQPNGFYSPPDGKLLSGGNKVSRLWT